MSIYEAIGMAWVIFSSALATIEILYLAFVGLRSLLPKVTRGSAHDIADQVRDASRA